MQRQLGEQGQRAGRLHPVSHQAGPTPIQLCQQQLPGPPSAPQTLLTARGCECSARGRQAGQRPGGAEPPGMDGVNAGGPRGRTDRQSLSFFRKLSTFSIHSFVQQTLARYLGCAFHVFIQQIFTKYLLCIFFIHSFNTHVPGACCVQTRLGGACPLGTQSSGEEAFHHWTRGDTTYMHAEGGRC